MEVSSFDRLRHFSIIPKLELRGEKDGISIILGENSIKELTKTKRFQNWVIQQYLLKSFVLSLHTCVHK